MQILDLFLNSEGRLRSGWRVSIFGIAFLIASSVLSVVLVVILSFSNGRADIETVLQTYWGFAAQGFILLVSAVVLGYACGKIFEDLPLKAIGWAPHKGWVKDWLIGSLIGALTLVFATLIATVFSSFKFALSEAQLFPAVAKTLIGSFLIFILAAAAEEALFRGYPLQTLTRAKLVWVGIVITSLFFALVHQGNPNQDVSRIVKLLAFINTALAGVWLAVLYLKTRSLWLPLGVHWAWNWMMAAVLGLPVSGITAITPNPLLRATDMGPVWLTGGAYGIEGGLACTIALIASTIFVWRTKLLSATVEMRLLTTFETPPRVTSRIQYPTFPTDDIRKPPIT